MRVSRLLLVAALGSLVAVAPLASCGGDDGNNQSGIACSDGKDNDGDGMTDFPDDLGCIGDDDESEADPPSPQCKDGRDNDGDGRRDYPNDPGCFAPQQDSEEDDCPDGPTCPQCADGKDNDGNGQTDFPNDSGGCMSASDPDEYTENPVACGGGIIIKKVPFTGMVQGTLMAGAASKLAGACGGMSATEDVYEIRVTVPKVIVASTDNDQTTADTVLYLRTSDCTNASTEVACADNVSTSNKKSTLTAALSTPGTYYLVVDAKDAVGGMYNLTVQYFVGEGTACVGMDDCGPGLICRVPKGQTQKVCSKHVCEDATDEDGDGKNGFPDDPGCADAKDDDEADTCPGVSQTCPECGDGVDNDMDTKVDYGTNGDPTCTSASSASESCVSTDGVVTINTAQTMGDTSTANNDTTQSCGSTTGTAPDRTYRLDLPLMASLDLNLTGITFDSVTALYNSTCGGAPIKCSDPYAMNVQNLAAGTYYFVVDGYSTGKGPYTINVAGRIANGQPCESPLATAGAITCDVGYACKGTAGSKTCQPAACSDGISNNDGDNKIDYPNDPGCMDAADDDETDPATAPVCSNGVDDDTDTTTDYPADYGCAAASGATEAFCAAELDATSEITTKTNTGTTVGKANNLTTTCGSSTAPEVTYALRLPVPVATLVIDTNQSAFDTVLMLRDSTCATNIACDDDSGDPTTQSKITRTGVAPGNYAITVDGYSTNSGTFILNVQGTVAVGTNCTSPLFSGGANAVLVCPTGTTCTGNRCQ